MKVKIKKLLSREAPKIPTPFFVYNFSVIERQFKKLRASLSPGIDIFYSVKTNPTSAILKFIQRLGLGAEVTSVGELLAVQKLRFPPEKIIFTGPGKTNGELEKAVKTGIYLIVIESLAEAKRIDKISQRFKKIQNILIRINMMQSVGGSEYKMSSGSQKFGVDEEILESVTSQILDFKNINLSGFHFYGASGILDYGIILSTVKNLFNRIKKIESVFKIQFPIIDIGGGFGIDYASSEIDMRGEQIKKFGTGLKILLKDYDLSGRKIILEVGRFLIAEAGSYITRVIEVKESRGRKFVIVDGGMNHLSRNSLVREGHDMKVINCGRKKRPFERVDIVGPLPTPTDILSRNVRLPRAKPNDLIIINKVGAYGLTAGMLYFSSRPLPAEYALINGELKLIRCRSEVEKTIFSNQVIPKQLYG